MKKYHPAFLVLFCLALYFFRFSFLAITDPDEVFYAETAREMIAHHSFFTPLIFEHVQFEKPPFFYWLLITAVKICGNLPLASRLVPAFFGAAGVVGAYLFLKRVIPEKPAFLSSLVLATSPLYFLLSKIVLTDVVFSVLVTFALLSFYLWYKIKAGGGILYLFALFAGLAVLTKGMLGIILPLATAAVFLGLVNDYAGLRRFLAHRWWLLFLALALPWYVFELIRYGRFFWWDFFTHNHWHRVLYAEHRNFDRWYFYPGIILVGMLPWTPYLLTIRKKTLQEHRTDFVFLASWIGAVFVLFTLAHSKLSSYILPMFPALAVVTGLFFAASRDADAGQPVYPGIVSIVLGFIFLLALRFAPIPPEWYLPGILMVSIFGMSQVFGGFFFLRRKPSWTFFCHVLGFSLTFISLFLLLPEKAGNAFSDRDLPAVIRQYDCGGAPILCDKNSVRGVYFYTRNPMTAVISNEENPFWDAQAVPIVHADEEISAFFGARPLVLCVISHKELKRLNRIFQGTREQQIISQDLDRWVVLSKRKRGQ